ncbi:rRNA-binding_endoribonuclease [Hexamita inflata]|uniref:rRNA-binding endoribonuclease n=1 Tax=Hexamita inflata TaxID=28002 RepID=A0AA86QSQ6_9EUKA|nr:rRNA-binding endoribonuclease [Hexamita inflata]
MSIKHLVIDTNYILNKVSELKAENVYATPDVIDEVRDEQSKEYLQTLDYFTKIQVRQPSQNSLKRIQAACIQIGELGSVSKQDVGVLALSLDILEETDSSFLFEQISSEISKQTMNIFWDSNAPSKAQLKKEEAEKQRKAAERERLEQEYIDQLETRQKKKKSKQIDISDILGQFKSTSTEPVQEPVQNNEPEKEEQIVQEEIVQEQIVQEEIKQTELNEQIKKEIEKKEEEGWGGDWVTADNINQLIERDMEVSALENVQTGLFTLDNAMQNIALQLHIPLVTPSNQQIKKITRYALKCPACCAVFVNMEPIIKYKRNKPFLSQLLNDNYNCNDLFCPECANNKLMRVSAFISADKVTFSKGRKHFNVKGQLNLCDVTSTKFVSLRDKYLLHPELYQEKMMRIIPQNKKNNFDFEADIQGVAGNVKGDEIAYFLRRGKKGVKFGVGLK